MLYVSHVYDHANSARFVGTMISGSREDLTDLTIQQCDRFNVREANVKY